MNTAQKEPEINPETVADPQTEVEELVDHFKDYLDTRRELFVLKLYERIFRIVSNSISWAFIGFLAVAVFLFLSLGAAFWINSLMKNSYAGFLVVAGIHLVIGILLRLWRNALIKKPLTNRMISHMLND